VKDWDSKRFQLNGGTFVSAASNVVTLSANFQTAELGFFAVGEVIYGETSGAYGVITTAPTNGAATFGINPLGAIGTGTNAAFTVGERLFVLNALPGGTSFSGIDLNGAASRTARGNLIVENLFKACQVLDEKDAPKDGRVTVLSPGAYYDILNSDRAIITDYNGGDGRNGTLAGNQVLSVAGFRLVTSNHLGINSYTSGQSYVGLGNQSAVTRGERPNYVNGRDGSDGQAASGTVDYFQDEQGNTSSIANCFGLCFTKEAVGTVSLKDVSMQMTGAEYKAMTQSTMMVASYAVGHGVLRPECCVSLLHDGAPY
jgi:hypothetical protein